MTTHDTYINRNIVNANWYKNINARFLMISLFMVVDENGQVVTSVNELETLTDMSKKEIVSALTLLENIEELKTEKLENGQIEIAVLEHSEYIRIGEFDDEP